MEIWYGWSTILSDLSKSTRLSRDNTVSMNFILDHVHVAYIGMLCFLGLLSLWPMGLSDEFMYNSYPPNSFC
jgi:hypothetical protein